MDPLKRLLFATTFMAQVFRSPEDDNGGDFEDQEEGSDGVEDDEGEDDALDGDEGEEQADHVEDDDDGEDEGQEDRPAQIAKGRGSNRVKEATRIAAEAKAKAEKLEQELQALRQTQNRPPAESPEQRAQRLANMDPDQRTEYLLREQENKFQSRLNAIEFNAKDSADKTAFESLCARDPIAAKFREQVEADLATMRASGWNSDRETILNHAIGKAARANGSRAKAKQERTAATNRTRQSARPSSSNSDVPAGNRRGGTEVEQRRKRLENMSI